MLPSDLSPKTKINLPSRNLAWVVGAAPQVYTFEDLHGNLAEEIGTAANGKIEVNSLPSIEPEEFEAAYHWFYS
jgi:hypothetical protein